MKQNKQKTQLYTGLTLYDLNKQMMKDQPELLAPELAQKQNLLTEWFKNQSDQYIMLLSNERHDYTIFRLGDCSVASAELFSCLLNRGKIISLEERPDGNYEIWLRIDEQDFFYMLFPCDDFVIEC